MAVCDAFSYFIYVDVGTNGRVSDGGVWGNTILNERIVSNTAGIPDDTQLPLTDEVLPFVFLADDAFPLTRHIMKPFPHNSQTLSESVFVSCL